MLTSHSKRAQRGCWVARKSQPVPMPPTMLCLSPRTRFLSIDCPLSVSQGQQQQSALGNPAGWQLLVNQAPGGSRKGQPCNAGWRCSCRPVNKATDTGLHLTNPELPEKNHITCCLKGLRSRGDGRSIPLSFRGPVSKSIKSWVPGWQGPCFSPLHLPNRPGAKQV